MRLKTVFLAGMGLFCAVAIVAAMAVVVGEWHRLRAVDQAATILDALRPALGISERLALERGGYNEALLNDQPAPAAVLTTIERLTARTEEAFTRAFAAVQNPNYPEREPHFGNLQHIHDKLIQLRSRAQAEIARPKAERDPAFITRYAEHMFEITAQVTDLQAGIELAADRTEPGIGQYAGIARVVGLLRDYAGRKQTLYVQILSGGRAVDGRMERLLADADARIDVLWTRLQTMVSLAGEPRLTAVVKTVQQQYFDGNAPVYERIRAAEPAISGWPGDVASFRAWGVPTLQAILTLRDTAFGIAAKRIAHHGAIALVNLGVALATAVAVALSGAFCAIYFGRRVIYPLSRIEAAVTEIADGRLAITVPDTADGNEIGRVARAVDTLRRKLIDAGNERDERERQLYAAKLAAEDASHAKSEFLAGMSHELRTPLNAVIGFSELMLMQLNGPLPTIYRDYAEDITTSAKHLLGLIGDLLDFSKIEAGALRLEEEVFDLRSVIETSLHMLDPRARSGEIELHRHLDIAFLVRGDAQRVKQVMLNLLSNSVKFTHQGGSVVTEAGLDSEGDIQIKVRDTGIGIAPEDLGRVMEVFGQAESQRRRAGEGTGLGLPLSRKLVEAMDGRLNLASEVGVGTMVTITLPGYRIVKPPAPPTPGEKLASSAA
jgi:signal transduction histidine kinase